MAFIKAFGEINKSDAGTAGGKGASLGEMTQAGIPVPPGFVILAGAFEQFLTNATLSAEIDTILHTVRREEMHTVENASERIQGLILNAQMPEDIARSVEEQFTKLDASFVAVRSSATAEDSASAAWAGQLDSYLNTTEETLLRNVQKCWASLFTPRAIFYRFEKELHTQKISVAVVVQKMVQSEVSGIAFSVHPVTEDYNQLIIEGGFGLGEAIVSGSVTPDSYVIEKEPRRIIEKNITYQSRALWRAENGGNEWRELSEVEGTKPALSDEQALELAEIVLTIERHYGFPCDIEWAYEAGAFFITQSRPITTLAPRKDSGQEKLPVLEKYFERAFPLATFDVWNRAEKTLPKLWTDRSNPHEPYIMSHWNGATSLAYYDFAGTAWIKQELKRRRAEDPQFFDWMLKESDTTADVIQRVADTQKPLPVADLSRFVENAVRAWSFLEAVWFSVEMFEEDQQISSPEMKKALAARKYSERLVPNINDIFERSLRTAYPELGGRVWHITIDEAISGTLPSQAELSRRAQGYCLMNNKLFMGITAEELGWQYHFEIKKEESPSIEDDTLKGTCAQAGSARGRVRIVFSRDQLGKCEEGCILVSPTTQPDFMPAITKCAAIITDEGGLVSHAAITSRELKKPCIIGTKVATQVLKDGDLVEVDADDGVVRIIERAQGGDNKEVVEFVKNTEWHSDWSGPFSLFGLSLPTNTYFDGMEKHFGKGLSHVFIAFKNGVAFSRLPEHEYHELGEHLAKKAADESFVQEWAQGFKTFADAVIRELPTDAEAYIKKLPELLAHYQAYGAHNAATKIAFDVGHESLPQEHKDLLEDARKYSETFYKDDANNIEKALRFLAEKTGYAYEEVYMLTYDELLVYLATNALPEKETLRKRWVASGVHFTKDKTTILSPEELAEIETARVTTAGTKELTGQSAYAGKVQGKCRIVLDFDNAIFKEGEILVTGMTDPHFIPLMKKARGIVTDGGGMLSHAAIVARELKTPCVVGTKVATQVLKDGDMVEVDADNGIVRKI